MYKNVLLIIQYICNFAKIVNINLYFTNKHKYSKLFSKLRGVKDDGK